MPMWHDHLQLDLQLKCVVTYDNELRCTHMAKICPLDDVHVIVNFFLIIKI
jgi:hypothetical protein